MAPILLELFAIITSNVHTKSIKTNEKNSDPKLAWFLQHTSHAANIIFPSLLNVQNVAPVFLAKEKKKTNYLLGV